MPRKHRHPASLPSARAKNPVPQAHRHAAHLARRFQQICLGVLAEVLEPRDLTPLQYAVLGSLDDAPGIDQRRLAERLGVDVVTAHHLVEQLEAAGLLDRRVAAEDRRARTLSLTALGTTLRQKLRPPMMATQDRILAPISRRERAVFMALLTRVIEGNDSYARPGNGRRRPRRKEVAAAN